MTAPEPTLRELAAAATPGEWWPAIVPAEWLRHRDPEDASWTVDSEKRMVSTDVGWFKDAQAEADARWIAAANPAAVLALLDRAEAAEAKVADGLALADEIEADHPTTAACLDDDGWRCSRCTTARALRAALRDQS